MSRKKWFSLTGNMAIVSGFVAIGSLLLHAKLGVAQIFEYSAVALAFVSVILGKGLPHKRLWNISRSSKLGK